MKVLITGATNGMGKGVLKALAAISSESNEIILLCRSEKLGIATMNEISSTENPAALSMIVCDLSDLSSVGNAITEIRQKHDFLDSIFVNAGIGYASRRTETVDGLDSHYQVNYLSQFYLVLQLLGLLEQSTRGGRVIFNATPGGRIFWEDLQMKERWNYEKAIRQAMVAKRMLLVSLHESYMKKERKVAFVGFSIHQTVWTNQINIIPGHMRRLASVMKALGLFISIEQCGKIMAPLFMESLTETARKSGGLHSWKQQKFVRLREDDTVTDTTNRTRLLQYSLAQCQNDWADTIFGSPDIADAAQNI